MYFFSSRVQIHNSTRKPDEKYCRSRQCKKSPNPTQCCSRTIQTFDGQRSTFSGNQNKKLRHYFRVQPASRDNQRQSTGAKPSIPPTPNKPQTAGQSRPITTDEMNAQRSVNSSQQSSAQRFNRTDSQTSGVSKKSEAESRHSSIGRQTPTQQAASKPPTAGSRPGTEAKQSVTGSRQTSAAGTPKTGVTSQAADNRPPSSVASTPKPTSGFNEQLSSDRMASSNTSRIATAADRFPKGLPNNAPVILIIGNCC